MFNSPTPGRPSVGFFLPYSKRLLPYSAQFRRSLIGPFVINKMPLYLWRSFLIVCSRLLHQALSSGVGAFFLAQFSISYG